MTAVIIVCAVAALYYGFRLVRYLRTPAELRVRPRPRPDDGDPMAETPSLWGIALEVVDAVTGGRR